MLSGYKKNPTSWVFFPTGRIQLIDTKAATRNSFKRESEVIESLPRATRLIEGGANRLGLRRVRLSSFSWVFFPIKTGNRNRRRTGLRSSFEKRLE